MDDAAQRQRAAGPADDVGMHREWDVLWALRAAFRIELVEISLPGFQPVIRIAVFAMAVAEQRAVTKRLPRQLDQQLAVLLPEERHLLVEAVGVKGEAVFDHQLDGVRALGARAPAVATATGMLLDRGDGLLHYLIFFVARQVAGDLVVVAMALDHMTVIENGLHGLREAVRDGAAGQERRLDVLFLQNPQQPIDRVVRAVFALAPHFVIEDAVLIRLYVLPALEVEGQEDGGAFVVRPTNEVVVMVFLEHAHPSRSRNGLRIRTPRFNGHFTFGPLGLVAKISE